MRATRNSYQTRPGSSSLKLDNDRLSFEIEQTVNNPRIDIRVQPIGDPYEVRNELIYE